MLDKPKGFKCIVVSNGELDEVYSFDTREQRDAFKNGVLIGFDTREQADQERLEALNDDAVMLRKLYRGPKFSAYSEDDYDWMDEQRFAKERALIKEHLMDD
jgi:hypothetical protein